MCTKMEEMEEKNPEASGEEVMKMMEAAAGGEAEVKAGPASFHIQDLCPDKHPECDRDEEFRSFNGRCNNLENGLWGSTLQALRRLRPAEYSDRKVR